MKRKVRGMVTEKTIFCSICHKKAERIDNTWGFCLVHGLMAMDFFQETLSEPGSVESEKDEDKKRKNLNSL